MKTRKEHLSELQKLRKKHYHPLQHEIHHTHKISRRTLFYVKEYGFSSNVLSTIIKESAKILVLASIISLAGGIALENIKHSFVAILPLIILYPALNGLIGGYGTIFSSRISTLLFEGKLGRNLWKNFELTKLFKQVLLLSIITALIASIAAIILAMFSNYAIDLSIILRVSFIALFDVLIMVIILFFVAVFFGKYFFKKQEDPNNFLIPITTSISDFGNLMLLSFLILLLF